VPGPPRWYYLPTVLRPLFPCGFLVKYWCGHLFYSVRPVPPSLTISISSVVSTTTVTSLTSKYFGYGDLLTRHTHQVGVKVLTGPNSHLADKDVPSNRSSQSGKDRRSSTSLWLLNASTRHKSASAGVIIASSYVHIHMVISPR